MTSTPGGQDDSLLSFHQLLERFGPPYLERFGPTMPARQERVLRKVLRCRTPAMGGELYQCDCGYVRYVYHSCNDRHCPRCGQGDAKRWLQKQQSRLLLPVAFFLITFTLPEALRAWIRSHPKIGYDLLFAASSQALQDFAANPRRLGAGLGMLGILHTWSRTLIYHPHVHYLVAGGGLSPDQRRWVASRHKYLFSVKALGRHFRTLFLQMLLQHDPNLPAQFPAKTWRRGWIVHCRAAGNGHQALGYLARYVFKTATSNRRLALLPNGLVRWTYRDSKTNRPLHIDLEPQELIRRFLQHVLPQGFSRVRFFGWLHPAARLRANRVRALLGQPPQLTPQEQTTWLAAQTEPTDDLAPADDPLPPARCLSCPNCGQPLKLIADWWAGEPVPKPIDPKPP